MYCPPSADQRILEKSTCDCLTSDIRSAMRSKNCHYRKYLKTRSQVTWDRYKTLRNEVNRQIRQAKASHLVTISQEIRHQLKLAWSKLNAAMGRTRCHPSESLLHQQRNPPDESTVANSLIDHLSTRPATPTAFTNPTTPAPCSTTFCFSQITEAEVLKKLSNSDAGKAMGPDRISARLLRMVAPSITPSITSLFNASLVSGQFSTEWKEVNITPVPKPGGKRNFSSLRPISVLPVLTKELESLVSCQLTEFLEFNKLLSDAVWLSIKPLYPGCFAEVYWWLEDRSWQRQSRRLSHDRSLQSFWLSVTPSFKRSLKSPEYVTLLSPGSAAI